MTMIADTSRIAATLDWTPQYDDLETIAAHALAWEEKLFQERHGAAAARRLSLNLIRRKPQFGLKIPSIAGNPDARATCARRRQWNGG